MLSKDRIGALFMLAFSLGYGLMATRIPLLPFQRNQAFTAQTMPEALAILGIALSLALLLKPGRAEGQEIRGFRWREAALICALMVAYGFLLRPGGFILATIAFLFAAMWLLGERRWLVLIGASVPIVIGFWALMTQGLDVFIEPFPEFMRG